MQIMPKLSRRTAVGSCVASVAAATAVQAADLDFVLPRETKYPPLNVPTPQDPSAQQLWETTAHKAFAFFWNETSPATGLTKDRARSLLDGGPDPYSIASIAATGYMLAALAIGVERGWIDRSAASARARTTLHFLEAQMPHQHGFFYHFVDLHTGQRVWKSEVSSIDTALLVLGALTAGQYFGGETAQRAEALFARIDWQWMQARRGDDPADVPLRMGWKPSGFLNARWQQYDESSLLYLLALGAPKYSLPGSAWDRWGMGEMLHEGVCIPGSPGPLFWAQMTPAYYPLAGLRDRTGRAWWQLWANAHQAHYTYCARNPQRYPRHQEPLWGISACGQPPKRPGASIRYRAQSPADGANDGTIAPTAALAAVTFMPETAERTLQDMFTHYGANAWGRYGFANAINPARSWADTDVIGIDLGMMLLAVENHRTGLIWRLISGHPAVQKGMNAAGFHKAA